MGRKSLNTYNITDNISIQLEEITKPENIQNCTYCGKGGNFWNETWPSALALSKYLAKEFSFKRLDGCQALVIGCGVGLEGIVLAKLGANVSFLDHIPEALQLVSQNCVLNGIDSFQTICCCWKDSENISKIGKYDIVVGSDVLYFFFYYLYLEEQIWLESLLKATLKTNGLALFSDPIRFDEMSFFHGLAEGGFQVKWADPRWASGNQNIIIHCIERL
jgi:predicted nicotinamide N-methyase